MELWLTVVLFLHGLSATAATCMCVMAECPQDGPIPKNMGTCFRVIVLLPLSHNSTELSGSAKFHNGMYSDESNRSTQCHTTGFRNVLLLLCLRHEA